MKNIKTLILFLLIFISNSFNQSFYFGWITDLHIGSPNAEEDLNLVVNDINYRKEIEFVVATGDITETGKNKDLIKAKEILDRLKVPYYIIPGNHDTKWSESCNTKFSGLWKSDRFVFEKHGIKFIGLNSGIPWRGGGGHISPEDLKWLDSIITTTSSNTEIYYFQHHQLDSETDNWFKVSNILRKANVKSVFVGHGHSNRIYNFNGISGAMSRSTLSKGKSWGYTYVECGTDSILFYEINTTAIPNYWGGFSKSNEIKITKIDSVQIENYNSKIVWQKELNKSLIAPLLVKENKIIAATKDGIIYCFDEYGKLKWQFDAHSKIYSCPEIENNIIVLGTVEGDLITIDAESGNQIQTIGLGEPITSQIILIPILVDNENSFGVIVGRASGKIACYELNSLSMIWENKDATGMIETKPLFINDRIIFGSWDTNLYCIDALTGVLNWKWNENKIFNYSPASCIPVADEKNIFVAVPDKYVSAIDLLLGKSVWRKNEYNAWESIGISNDKKRIFIKSVQDKLFIISVDDGKKIKEVDIKFGIDTAPNEIIETDGKIILNGKSGIIYLIDEKYNFQKLFFMGTARTHTIQKLKEKIFVASNMDGKIVMFEIK